MRELKSGLTVASLTRRAYAVNDAFVAENTRGFVNNRAENEADSLSFEALKLELRGDNVPIDLSLSSVDQRCREIQRKTSSSFALE
jgi:hypothetical protein